LKNIPQNRFPVILLLFLTTKAYTQLNAVTIGDAQSIGNNCYVITENVLWQRGGVWYDNPIDFDEDFTIYYKNNFGSTDSQGADGMALVFKRTNIFTINDALGDSGGGVGYEGITNSLIVEFDTYRNNDKNDPLYDHLSIMINGNASHSNPNNLVGPVQPTSTTTNMEDGVDHNVKIVWTASTQIFEVFFDCELRLTLNRDIKGTIFGGDSTVFFGFVGSTGGLSNLHQVCFNSISFVDNLLLQPQTICNGESAQVDAEIPSGNTYTWSPSTGVSDVNIPNPILSPNNTTTYTVTIEDECGEATIESVEITVTPQNTTTFDPIDPICEGDSNPLPTTDINGVTGSWAPAFDATTTTDYSFTPDPGQCATTPAPVQVVVNPIITTTFDTIDPICEGDSNPLPTTDLNGVTGSWTPAFDATTTTDYSFTPDPGQCATTPAPVQVVVNPIITTTFDAIDPICEGDSNPLPTTDINGVTGSWAPAFDATTTTDYSFTPDPGQCATTPAPVQVVVNPIITTTFDPIDPICEGDSNPLPTTDINGVTGSWAPAFDATTTTDYSFTPDAGQCATTPAPVQVVVNPIITTTFDPIDPICEGDSNPLPTTDINGVTGNWTPAFDATTTTDYSFTPDAGQCATTPAPVQVVVNPIVTPAFDSIDPICAGDSIAPLPTTSNNGITGTWNPATIDNTTTDVYTFTPDAGVCVIPTTIEITVLQQITPTFLIDDICIGESSAQLPVVSEENISGSWFPATVNNLVTTTYTFTPDPGQCANTTTETINVNPINTLSIATENTSAPFDSNQIIEVTVTGGSGNYEYQLDGGIWQNSPVFQNVIGCQEHIVKVRDEEGCSNEPESVVTILSYPKFFTPNGDGYNDFWNIECLKNRTGLISIFDRFGKLLKQFKTTSSGWNGSYNDALMPTSDYWFMVRYFDENGLEKEFRSHFTLRR